jgi:hypothetical protein
MFRISMTDTKVTRYGYRKARAIRTFLTVEGRCSKAMIGDELRQMQVELDMWAGFKGGQDNHCTYVLESTTERMEGPHEGQPKIYAALTFTDGLLLIGNDVLVKDW